jgi:hypothetical protein
MPLIDGVKEKIPFRISRYPEDFDEAVSRITAMSEPSENDFLDDDYESNRIVFVSFPGGQIVPVPFTGEEWKMVHEISEESGDDIPDVIEDVIAGRLELIRAFEQSEGYDVSDWDQFDLDDFNDED